jgi:anti-sigma factor RsiW
MSDADTPTTHEEFEALFSDLHDGVLVDPDRARLVEHLGGCAACKTAYDEFEDTMRALGQVGKGRSAAPEAFTRSVEDTIHRRSAGRFFGRRTLGDRVPFGLLVIVALVVLGAIAALLWTSATGSLRR